MSMFGRSLSSESSGDDDSFSISKSTNADSSAERSDLELSGYGSGYNPTKEFYNNFGGRKRSIEDSDDEEETSKRRKMSEDSSGAGPARIQGLFRKSYTSTEDDSAEDEVCASPEVQANDNTYNKAAWKMMAKMGYQKGKGLGSQQQGRVEIVEASRQRGRRGLGMKIEGLEPASLTWDASLEKIEIKKEALWFPECEVEPPEEQEMKHWRLIGPKKRTIDDETTFCSPGIVTGVLSAKSVFDQLEDEELRKARTRSNPFETIRGGIFLNRAAMKMANMDADLDFMFTNPKNRDGSDFVKDNELLYFADVCSGPGGFSEYVLWRKKCEAKGFGFTLRGSCDFRLEDFFAAPCECLETYYGEDDTGDVFVPENQLAFKRLVMESTGDEGVHFMMADGGFSVEGQENIQEILSKQLYLCQCLVAVMIVRPGGHFVCKLFDLFTPFSVGLVYLMYRCFDVISIHKPNTSRPANSERYLMCKWKKQNTVDVEQYMFETNRILGKLMGTTSKEEVNELVPLEVMRDDDNFFDSLVDSNNIIGEQQIIGLKKIQAFCRDTTLVETKQLEIRRDSLKQWAVPDEARRAPPKLSADEKIRSIIANHKCRVADFVQDDEKTLNAENFTKVIKSVHDFRCVVLGTEKEQRNTKKGLIVGTGRSSVYMKQISRKDTRCEKVDLSIELPRDTLVYGEIVQELRGEGRGQKKIFALHIIDAFMLGGKDVSMCNVDTRHTLCEKFSKAVSKKGMAPIRAKKLHRLEDFLKDFHRRLSVRLLKNNSERLVYSIDSDDDRFIVPSALLFMQVTKEPWSLAFSRTHNRTYFYNRFKNQSLFEEPQGAMQNFIDSMKLSLPWWWESGVCIMKGQSRGEEQLHMDMLVSYIKKLMGR